MPEDFTIECEHDVRCGTCADEEFASGAHGLDSEVFVWTCQNRHYNETPLPNCREADPDEAYENERLDL